MTPEDPMSVDQNNNDESLGNKDSSARPPLPATAAVNHSQGDGDSTDEDDKPLSFRKPTNPKLKETQPPPVLKKKTQPAKKEEDDKEDSTDDDKPLSAKKPSTNATAAKKTELAAKRKPAGTGVKIKKKEKEDEHDSSDGDMSLSSKKSNPKRSTNIAVVKKKPVAAVVRKEEEKEDAEESDDDFEPIGVRKPNFKPTAASAAITAKKKESGDYNKPVAKKKPASADKKMAKKEEKRVKDGKGKKKVYTSVGQKRDTPEERDPLRIFYESLYEQVPTSEMAQIWMMESGLLPAKLAQQVFEKRQAKKQTLRSPAKPPTITKSVTVAKELSTSTKKAATKVVIEKKEATTSAKSATVTKKQPSSADSTKNKKSPATATASKKRKAADSSDDGSDDDFEQEVNAQPKRRKLVD